MHWERAYASSATWTVFLKLAEAFLYQRAGAQVSEVFVSPLTQLIEVNAVTKHGDYGGALDGRYAAAVRTVLTCFPEYARIPEVEDAMVKAYHRMMGVRSFEKSSFRAQVQSADGWFVTNCPGSRSGLHPAHDAYRDIGKGWGYEFQCANVDTPVQQLTLLAGLAALITLLRTRGVEDASSMGAFHV
ncbi:MAG: hypothetical protein Q7S84_04700 [bacterium]|nr:hypothetical protein [bacterium]